MISFGNQINIYLYLFTLAISLVICLITTFYRKSSNQNAGILLALINWLFFYSAFVGYLILSGKIVLLPHLYRTAQISMLLYMPVSYFYINQTLFPRRLRISDLIHLVPVLVYLVDYFPFFIKSGSEKMSVYRILESSNQNFRFAEGLFMPAFYHYVSRYIIMLAYWIAQVTLIKKMLAAKRSKLKQQDPAEIKWLKWFTGSELMIILPPLLAIGSGSFINARLLGQLCGLIAACIQAYFLFTNPGILYGLKGIFIESEKPAVPPVEKEKVENPINEIIEKQPIHYLSEDTLDKIQEELDSYMKLKKPYLKEGFGLNDLAAATSFSTHQVSAYINKRCEMNFYNYVNRYRIEYCKEKFVSREYINKTLEAIAHESGFHSRTTFIRAFKKYTGNTPSEFIKELKKDE